MASSNSVHVFFFFFVEKKYDKLKSKHTVEVSCDKYQMFRLFSPLLLSSFLECNFVATSQAQFARLIIRFLHSDQRTLKPTPVLRTSSDILLHFQ